MLTRAKFIAALASGTMFAAMASGCSILGIEDPNAQQTEPVDTLPEGAVDFENLIVALDVDSSVWAWTQIDNPQSQNNGTLIVGVPATVTNNDEMSRVLSPLYCKILDPNGQSQTDITAYFDDDLLTTGNIPVGQEVSGTAHILYKGAGTYTLSFDNLLGAKTELEIDIPSSRSTGMRAIPARLGTFDVSTAVPELSPFDVGGLTLTFDRDMDSDGDGYRDTYLWTQTFVSGDPVWDGRWCVGVPVTITNNSSQAEAITADLYAKFNPGYARQDDPAPYFVDDVTAMGSVGPGQTVRGWVYFVYEGDGTYYIAFDNNGTKIIASVLIEQYYTVA